MSKAVKAAACSSDFEEHIIPKLDRAIMTGLSIVIVVFIVLSSVTLILGLCKTKQTNLFMYKLMILLGVLDLFIACTLIPLFIGVANNRICELNKIHTALTSFVELSTMLVTLLLSVDRYFFIAKTNFHRRYNNSIVTFSITTLAVLFISITAAVMLVVALNTKVNPSLYLVILATVFSALLFSMMIPNAFLIRFIRRKANVMQKLHMHTTPVSRYKQRATTTIQLITFLLMVTYIPAIGGLFYIAQKHTDTEEQHLTVFICLCLPWTLNSGLNSVVFISRNLKIKSYYRKLLRTTMGSQRRTNTQRKTTMTTLG